MGMQKKVFERRIAVLIPCYNEEKTITKVVSDFREVLPEAKVYVYDNNSTDKSVELAKKAGAVVRREFRQGKGNVVRSMFRDIDASIYVMVDADDTYRAKDVLKMIRVAEENHADMVIGDRLSSTYFKENKRFGHNFGNILVRKLINLIFHAKVDDVMTGYRVFSYRFVKTFPVLSGGFQVETEMTVHALDKKMNISSVMINYKDRPADSPSKLNTYKDGARVLTTIFNMIKEFRPLMFFSMIALISFIVAAVLVVPILIEFSNTHLVTRLPTLFVSVMLFILSFLAFSTGLVLDLIAKKHRQDFEISLNMLCKK